MRVIGIDPGVARTGYAVLERAGSRLEARAVGVVRTSSELGQGPRLVQLRRGQLEVVDELQPEVAVVERLFFNVNVRTAMAVGQAAGVALEAVAERGLDTAQYTPLEVKQSVVGTGSAAKRQVQAMVAAILRLPGPPKPADAADACALAICHINRSRLARAVEAAR